MAIGSDKVGQAGQDHHNRETWDILVAVGSLGFGRGGGRLMVMDIVVKKNPSSLPLPKPTTQIRKGSSLCDSPSRLCR